jgi:predicted enzyme involved in methoxymalonyl-ACP biosynthesis
MRFLELKKNLKKDFTEFKAIKLALMGDSATQHLSQAIKGYGYEVRLNLQVFESNYDQIDRQISHTASDLYDFKPDFVVLIHSVQKLKKILCGRYFITRFIFEYRD